MSPSDEPPSSRPSLGVDTREFFLPGSGTSALLIHGLTGTPYEMRYLGERLAAVGVRVRGVRLAGHAGEPEELGATGHNNWYESVVEGFEDLRKYRDPSIVVGLSMGALLGARLALDQREDVAGIVMLAPAFYLPRTPTIALNAIARLGSLSRVLYLFNDRGSDIHDAAARRIHPTARLMPLSAPINLLALSRLLRRRLPRITQPLLLMHAAQDHTCPMRRNVSMVMKKIGSSEKRSVILEESYHVITVDSEKQRVAEEVLGFVQQFRTNPQRRAAGGA